MDKHLSENKALFLDRDGVINYDFGYVCSQKNFKFIDGIFELTKCAISKGYHIIVITNQGGIGKGLYSENDFTTLTKWMCSVFQDNGVEISKVYYCINHPAGIHKYRKFDYRRKPNPGMLIEARDEFHLNLTRCLFVGDQLTDMQAGRAAGIAYNFLYNPKVESTNTMDAEYRSVSKLVDIINFL